MPKAAPRHFKHIINVEIDGPRHVHARTRGFTQRRDEHPAHSRASGALGPDVTGAAEERDDEIMQDFRDLIKGL
jgi:hypothetical protein